MKVWRAFTLAFWGTLITVCVSLIAVYFVLSQTLLNPTAVKRWLDQSGSYAVLAEIVVPNIVKNSGGIPSNSLVADDMLMRAAKASITADDVKAKSGPIIDAVYAWLDSKSPEITFSIPVTSETDRFLQALRNELFTKIKSLPECQGFIDPSTLADANCLPPYVTTDGAVDFVMERVQQQELFRDKVLTPTLITGKTVTLNQRIPDAISLFWVIQLIAMPVVAVLTLFLIIKRRATGLIAVAVALAIPALALLVVGLLAMGSGETVIASLLSKSDLTAIAAPLSKAAASSVASTSLLTGGVLAVVSIGLGGCGTWWRKRRASQI